MLSTSRSTGSAWRDAGKAFFVCVVLLFALTWVGAPPAGPELFIMLVASTIFVLVRRRYRGRAVTQH